MPASFSMETTIDEAEKEKRGAGAGNCRIHSDRVVGCNCHHCHPGRLAPPCTCQGQGQGLRHHLHQQLQAVAVVLADVHRRQRQRRPSQPQFGRRRRVDQPEGLLDSRQRQARHHHLQHPERHPVQVQQLGGHLPLSGRPRQGGLPRPRISPDAHLLHR